MRHKEKAERNPCRVYWGSHGCRKQRGHKGNHICSNSCGRLSPMGYALYTDGVVLETVPYGEDWHGPVMPERC